MAQILIYGYSKIGKAIAGNLKMPKEEILHSMGCFMIP